MSTLIQPEPPPQKPRIAVFITHPDTILGPKTDTCENCGDPCHSEDCGTCPKCFYIVFGNPTFKKCGGSACCSHANMYDGREEGLNLFTCPVNCDCHK